jgi:hypothetical protein
VPGDEIGLVGQRDAAFLFQHAQHGDGMGHDRGLGVLGQGQRLVGPLRHDLEQLLAQRVVDFLEHFARGGAGGGEFGAHAHLLAALPRKNECPHGEMTP